MHLKPVLAAVALQAWLVAVAPVSLTQAQPPRQTAPRQTMQAKELAAKAAQAAQKLTSLNYAANVSSDGAGAPKYSGTVGAQRTEAGPWALLVTGTMTSADGKTKELRVAYDGVTGRAVNEAHQSVVESNATEEADVRLFFMSQEAGSLLAWDILSANPMDFAGTDVSMEIVGRGNIDGQDCKILQITRPHSGASEITRYFIPASDFLPRKIERVTQGKTSTSQTLLLNGLTANEKLAPSQFVLSVPDGYTVKVADKKPPKPPKPAPVQARSTGGLAVGDTAPDFRLKDSRGVERSLADYKGKVIVMDFWGTWCGPCVMAMPAIQKVHEKFRNKPVAVIGMNVEHSPTADAAGFMKKKGCSYELLLNAETVTGDFRVRSYPTLMVIGMDGKVAFIKTGYSPDLETILTTAVEEALVQ